YGRSERTAPPNQWKAVATRDGGCRFPGCDRPPRWCHAHHLQHWTDGGRTDLDNLALLCGHHHRLIHDGGWQAKLLPDLTLEVTAPDGRVRTSRPAGLEPPRLL
ncbi:MAG: HNH endonuclease signature motif containing protein, partial [Actinomycetota bacterium]|nr:HNH endonuclease signature motif containing protein [Actinomycetota bacterium]